MEKKKDDEWYYDIRKLFAIMQKKHASEKYYLFLDFDGVINLFCLPGTKAYEEKSRMEEFEFFDRGCVKRITDLCHDFPIHIVISSSWRYSGLEYCRDYLHKAGLAEDIPVVGITETSLFRPREEEVTEYLFAHPDFSGFLIFDDGLMPHLRNYSILTDPLSGYDQESDQKARNLLFHFQKSGI